MTAIEATETSISPKRKWRNRILIGLFAPVFITTMYGLAFGSVVLNGTSSLPHNAYFMLRWPLLVSAGSYVAFEAPDVIPARFKSYSFVKHVVGVPGDEVTVNGYRVCLKADCRELQPEMIALGVEPLAAMTLGPDQYLVFGDSDDSLDSRYAQIGPIPIEKIEAVGFPIPFPHWKEILAWFH